MFSAVGLIALLILIMITLIVGTHAYKLFKSTKDKDFLYLAIIYLVLFLGMLYACVIKILAA